MIEGILNTLEEHYGPPRVLELGKIKIGGLGEEKTAKGGRKYRMPRKDDRFHVTTLMRDDKGDLVVENSLMNELMGKYGDKGALRQIPIRVLSDDIGEILTARFAWYGSTEAGAVSDGNTVTWYRDINTMAKLEPPREEPWKPEMLSMTYESGKPLFKLHSIFRCVIACGEARWGGVYTFRTASIISFRQLYAGLKHIANLTGGILMGLPLMLVVRPMKVKPEGKATSVHVVHVEGRGSDFQEIAYAQARFRVEFRDKLAKSRIAYGPIDVLPGEEKGTEYQHTRDEFDPIEGDNIESRFDSIRTKFLDQRAEDLEGLDPRVAFAAFVSATAGRTFDVADINQWTHEDLTACENRLFNEATKPLEEEEDDDATEELSDEDLSG